MSCFGKVVLLPSGEVAEAAAGAAATAAAATATANAMEKGEKDSAPKVKEQEKADAKTRLKRKVTCEIRGGGVKEHPHSKLRCSYYCPGDPPGLVHDVLLDIDTCPDYWDFYL